MPNFANSTVGTKIYIALLLPSLMLRGVNINISIFFLSQVFRTCDKLKLAFVKY